MQMLYLQSGELKLPAFIPGHSFIIWYVDAVFELNLHAASSCRTGCLLLGSVGRLLRHLVASFKLLLV